MFVQDCWSGIVKSLYQMVAMLEMEITKLSCSCGFTFDITSGKYVFKLLS